MRTSRLSGFTPPAAKLASGCPRHHSERTDASLVPSAIAVRRYPLPPWRVGSLRPEAERRSEARSLDQRTLVGTGGWRWLKQRAGTRRPLRLGNRVPLATMPLSITSVINSKPTAGRGLVDPGWRRQVLARNCWSGRTRTDVPTTRRRTQRELILCQESDIQSREQSGSGAARVAAAAPGVHDERRAPACSCMTVFHNERSMSLALAMTRLGSSSMPLIAAARPRKMIDGAFRRRTMRGG
jgi:hypothetical protein